MSFSARSGYNSDPAAVKAHLASKLALNPDPLIPMAIDAVGVAMAALNPTFAVGEVYINGSCSTSGAEMSVKVASVSKDAMAPSLADQAAAKVVADAAAQTKTA